MGRRTLIIGLSLLLIISTCLFLCSCNDTPQYSVSYVSGDIEVTGSAPSGGECGSGATLTIAENTFVRDGYTFVGWRYGDKTYSAGDTFTMPESNVQFTAQWEKKVVVSFCTFDGTAIAPMAVDKGSTLSVVDIPVPEKSNSVFTYWFLDSALTERYFPEAHVFTSDSTLYAAYSDADEADFTQYSEEETTLSSQENSLQLILVAADGSVAPTTENIGSIVTLSRLTTFDGSETPDLTVVPQGDGRYALKPNGEYAAGQEYSIEAKSGYLFEVETSEADDDKLIKRFSRVNFGITAETANEKGYKADIIRLERGEYTYYDGQSVLVVGNSVFVAKGINNASVLCVVSEDGDDVDTDPDEEFFKAGEFTEITLDGASAAFVEIALLECELTDVYEFLEYYEETALELEPYVDRIDADAVASEIASNPELNYFMRLAAASAADYAAEADVGAVTSVEEKDTEVRFSVEKHDKLSFTATVTANGIYKLANNVYAEITVSASQYIFVGLRASGKVKLTEWNFDVKALLTSTTDVQFDVVLIKDGKRINIKDKIQQGIDEYEPNGFVAQYKSVVGMRTEELTLIRVTLFRPSVVLGNIFELGFPVDFVVSTDVNGAFSADVLCTVKKNFGMRGNSSGEDKGVKSYTENVSTKYTYDFYYYGQTTLKAGISFGVELSFRNLSSLGRAGLEIEVGAYFEFSGYGSYYVQYPVKIQNYNSDMIKKTQGAYYYEFGIYLELGLYFRSDILDFSADYTAVDKRFKLFEGGEERMAVKFSEANAESVQTSSASLSVSKLNVYDVDFMRLTDGKVESKRIGDKLLFFADGNGLYVDENNNIRVHDYYKNVRVEGKILVRYYGLHANLAGSYLDYTVNYVYIPAALNIAPEDADKTFTVKFMIEDTVYDAQTVRIGEPAIAPFLGDDWYDDNPQYLNVVFDHRTLEPIMKDTVYNAYVRKRGGSVIFSYLVKDETLAKGREVWETERVDDEWGETCEDLLQRLNYAVGDVDPTYYTFVGWPQFGPIEFETDDGTMNVRIYKAIYDKKDVTVSVHVEPFITSEGKTLFPERNYSYAVPFMDRTNGFLINYAENGKNPGFEVQYRVGGADGEIIPTGGSAAAYLTCYTDKSVWIKYTQTMTFTVRVFRSDGSVLYQRDDVTYGEDVRDIMQSQAVLDYIAEGPVPANADPDLPFDYEFKNWWYESVDDLDFVFRDMELRPCFDYVFASYKVFLDGNGGVIPTYMSHAAQTGLELGKNTVLTDSLFSGFIPTGASDETDEYTFAGWGYKDAQNNLVALKNGEYKLSGDVTLYAMWNKVGRTYDVLLNAADGIYYSANSGESVAVEGSIAEFDGQQNVTEKRWSNLSKSDKDALVSRLTGADAPIPVPTGAAAALAYSFGYWQVSEFGDEGRVVLEAVYKLADGNVDIVCTLNGGDLSGIKDTFTESLAIKGSESVLITIGNFTSPTSYEEWTYDDRGELFEQSFAFKDDNYYYVFDGWLYGDETEVMERGRQVLLQADSADVRLTATYRAVAQIRTVKFEIETLYPHNEKFDDGEESWSKTLYGYYGSALAQTSVPTVSKTDADAQSLYVYEFKGWQIEKSGLIAVTEVYNANYVYKPVFEKKLRELTIVFDAGEKGIFASTGERYRRLKTFAGVTLQDFGEQPIYDLYNQEISAYYDYEFMYWDYVEPYNFTTTEAEVTVTALLKAVRNNQPAPDVGITVSKDGVTEDIGRNTIDGYEYNPDEKTLTVTDVGFTVDGGGNAFALKLFVKTSELTLKNITLSAKNDAALYVAYYPTDAANAEVTLNIVGTVCLKGDFDENSGHNGVIFGGNDARFSGEGSGATLSVEAKFSEAVINYARAVTVGAVTFEGLTVNAEIDVTASTEEVYFLSVMGSAIGNAVTLTDSTVNVSISGAAAGKAFAAKLGANAYIDESSKAAFTLSGCALSTTED